MNTGKTGSRKFSVFFTCLDPCRRYFHEAASLPEHSSPAHLRSESPAGMIRPLTENDLEELAILRMAEQPTAQDRRQTQAALQTVFPRLFFRAPTAHPRMPGLVSTDSSGRLTGMIAVATRELICGDQPLQASIGADLFVARTARSSMAGLALLKELLNGPQDVTIADVANNNTRQIWERLGGFVASSWNVNWIGILRPARLAAELLRERRGGRIPAAAMRPAARLLDRLVSGRLSCRMIPVRGSLSEAPLTPELFSEHLTELTDDEQIRPVYSTAAAQWLWERLPYLTPDSGPVSAVAVSNSHGRLLGWYIYTLRPEGVARVAQIVARSGDAPAVISHLFARAHDAGAAAVAGRMQPRFQQMFIDRGCFLAGRQTCTLIHSRHPHVADAYQSGRAWLSVLDGEAPFNIWNRPEDAAAAAHTMDERPLCVVQPADIAG